MLHQHTSANPSKNIQPPLGNVNKASNLVDLPNDLPLNKLEHETIPFVCFGDIVKATPFQTDPKSPCYYTCTPKHVQGLSAPTLSHSSEPESPVTPGIGEIFEVGQKRQSIFLNPISCSHSEPDSPVTPGVNEPLTTDKKRHNTHNIARRSVELPPGILKKNKDSRFSKSSKDLRGRRLSNSPKVTIVDKSYKSSFYQEAKKYMV